MSWSKAAEEEIEKAYRDFPNDSADRMIRLLEAHLRVSACIADMMEEAERRATNLRGD